MNPLRRALDRALAPLVDAKLQAALAAVDDSHWRDITGPAAQRPWYETRSDLDKIQEACRKNPLAARVVALRTHFVVGAGPTLTGSPAVLRFWNDPRNALPQSLYTWCDELTRAGEIFPVLSTDTADGSQVVRLLPARLVDQIESDPGDVARELRYHQQTADPEGRWWPSPETEPDAQQVMLHYAVNRPAGQQRGTSDLAPCLVWLERYDLWLEDRVRINRYKGAYLWHVKLNGALPGQVEARRAQYSRVPSSGSIIVTDGSEEWTAVQPSIAADDAEADGKAIRLMIAAGSGIPLHYLAEAEGANRATAAEQSTPTMRTFAARQWEFRTIVEQTCRLAAARAGETAPQATLHLEPVQAEDRQANPQPATENQP